MNMFNKLPHFVYINNEKFNINTDFRIFIDFEIEMQGKDTKKAVNNCLNRFYPAFNLILKKNLLNEAVDKFIWFYKCGKEEVKNTKKSTTNTKLRIYDYNYDSDLIWGAFYTQYKVDLTKSYIHWWKFRSMWVSLDDKCEFSKIRGYRAYTGKDEDILELKELYKLPLTESEIDESKRRNKIFEELNKLS